MKKKKLSGSSVHRVRLRFKAVVYSAVNKSQLINTNLPGSPKDGTEQTKNATDRTATNDVIFDDLDGHARVIPIGNRVCNSVDVQWSLQFAQDTVSRNREYVFKIQPDQSSHIQRSQRPLFCRAGHGLNKIPFYILPVSFITPMPCSSSAFTLCSMAAYKPRRSVGAVAFLHNGSHFQWHPHCTIRIWSDIVAVHEWSVGLPYYAHRSAAI